MGVLVRRQAYLCVDTHLRHLGPRHGSVAGWGGKRRAVQVASEHLQQHHGACARM